MALAVALAVSSGCVTLAPRSREPGPRAVTLDRVPLRSFGLQECGAASLAAVLRAQGHAATVAELDARLPKAANGGVLTLDLVLEARSRGFRAHVLEGGPDAALEVLRRGLPAILVLRVLDAPGVRRDFFHYVIADGFDPDRDLVRVQFGDGRRRWTTFRKLERPWRAAGHALIMVEPRSGEEPTAPAGVRYAVSLEESGDLAGAAGLYRSLLESEPAAALLWTNLGNVEAARGDPDAAEAAYRRALAVDPAHRDALNNLAWLLLDRPERLDEALELARRAVETDGPDPHQPLDTLARALALRGDCPEALSTAERALALAPPASKDVPELERHRAHLRAVCP